MRHNALPQGEQLTFHRRPTLLHIRETLGHNTNELRRSVWSRTLSERRRPPVVRRVNEHLEWAARSSGVSRSLLVQMRQNCTLRKHSTALEKSILVLLVRAPNLGELDTLSFGTVSGPAPT